jgi:poly(A) polymerase
MANYKGLLQSQLDEFITSQVDACGEIFLVGGAIRNMYLRKEVQDLDFAVKKDAIKAAKNVADKFNGDFYILDKKRGAARALISIRGKELKIDFSLLNGNSIDNDLMKRDFTINAMAIKIPLSSKVIDPLNGKGDIKGSILRSCSSNSFQDDPVRTIRAIRFMNEFNLFLDQSEVELIKSASRNLDEISNERKRDEIVNIIEKTDGKKPLTQMLEFGIIENVFPEVKKLYKMELDSPHIHDAWTHTLQVVNYCQQLMALSKNYPDLKRLHPRIKQAINTLSKYKNFIFNYMNDPINMNRSVYSLLILACIYHDAGKGVIPPIIKGNRKSFPKHAKMGSELIHHRAKIMGFSNDEVEYLTKIVRFHMKLSQSKFTDNNKKDIHIHRFFKKTGSAGILVGFIHLADVLATYEDTLTEERWNRAVFSVNNIFDAYFIHHEKIITPLKLINGNDILKEFNLQPGKKIGGLLERVAEAQVNGEINTKGEAIDYLSKLLMYEKNNRENL